MVKSTDLILVPRELLGGAAYAIEKNKEAPNILAKLRELSMTGPVDCSEPPLTAHDFLEVAAKIAYETFWEGALDQSPWVDREANAYQNRARNLVAKILALPGAEHYHGYQKTGGDFGIIRDETGDDIDVAFAVGRFTFMVADSEDTVNIVEADGENWKRQSDFPIVVVEHFLKGLFDNVIPDEQDTLELTNEMEVHPDPIAAQMEGDDIFLIGSLDNEFKSNLAATINRHSIENQSNTPDFILAEFAEKALRLFADTSRARERWYGQSLSIGQADDKPLWFVGGYSLQLIGDQKIKVTNYDNSTFEMKVKQIVDFLDRRASPNERPLDPDHGN